MVRERWREEAPLVPHEEGVGLVGFRVSGASGKWTVDEAGLDVRALVDIELLSGLSHGEALCRRREPGLS